MWKKILLGLLIVLVLVLGYGAYGFFYATRQHSPKEVVTFNKNSLELEVVYCRPYKKGRQIFGNGAEALVPYGKYWRTGANYATLLKVNQKITFGDQTVEPGEYWLYTVPGEKEWKVNLNSGQKWGAIEPDYSEDVASTKGTVTARSQPLEQFTIEVKEYSGGQVNLKMSWDLTDVIVPIVFN